MFDKLEPMPQDAILKIIAEFEADERPNKIDLGVGVYRDQHGNTPILNTVKVAERRLVDQQTTKAYLGSSGYSEFNTRMQTLAFGESAAGHDRITTLQTPGGSGSLRVAAELVRRANPQAAIWAGSPTWANHVPLLSSAGIEMKMFPYYDDQGCRIVFDRMLEAIERIPEGDLLLLHGCCHNPTGMDLDKDQWQQIGQVVAERRIIPFVDMAYQGFADGLEEDAYGVRQLFSMVPEMLVATSCSKNFALYRDRVGALSVVSESSGSAGIVRSQVNNIVRTMYSMPPDHGAAVVAMILGDTDLRTAWVEEVGVMRSRLNSMRARLAGELEGAAPHHDFSHFTKGKGMFSFIGISPEQVERLKTDYAVYAVASSRINFAGVTEDNLGHLAGAIAGVMQQD